VLSVNDLSQTSFLGNNIEKRSFAVEVTIVLPSGDSILLRAYNIFSFIKIVDGIKDMESRTTKNPNHSRICTSELWPAGHYGTIGGSKKTLNCTVSTTRRR